MPVCCSVVSVWPAATSGNATAFVGLEFREVDTCGCCELSSLKADVDAHFLLLSACEKEASERFA